MTRRSKIFINLFMGMSLACLGIVQAQDQQSQPAPGVQAIAAYESGQQESVTQAQFQAPDQTEPIAEQNVRDFGSPQIPSILKGTPEKNDPFGFPPASTEKKMTLQSSTQTGVQSNQRPIASPETNPGYIPPQPRPIAPDELEKIRRSMEQVEQAARAPLQRQQKPQPAKINTEVQRPVDQIKIASASPQIRVTTTGPRTASINEQSAYTVNVANDGSLASGSLMIAVEIPQHIDLSDADLSIGSPEVEKDQTASRILWTIPNVSARSQENMIIRLTPKQAIPFDLNVEWTFVPFTGGSKIQVTEPKLAMEISGPGEVKFGEKAIYTITLNNPGTGNAENVVVMLSDTLGGEQASVGRLAPGDRKQFEVELIARDAGQIDLGATVKADNGINVESVKPITVRRARLEVAITAPKFKYAGSDIGYRVNISNSGDAIAENVVAAIALPTGAEYLGGIQGAEVTENGTALRWNIGPMHAGKVQEYSFQCLLKQPGNARLEVGARGEESLAAAAVGETQVDALADLTLTVQDPRGPQPLNQEVLYQIQIENRGTKEATNVNLVGQFSPGIEPVRTSGLNAEIVPGSVAFQTIPSIPVGKKVVVQVIAKADATGTHTFRAELNCIDQDIRRVSEGTTKYFITPEAHQDDAPRTSNQSTDGGFSR